MILKSLEKYLPNNPAQISHFADEVELSNFLNVTQPVTHGEFGLEVKSSPSTFYIHCAV